MIGGGCTEYILLPCVKLPCAIICVPLTYPVVYLVYVVHVLYCTVVGLQYLEEYVSHQGILLISKIIPGPKKQRMYPAANACLLPDPLINLQPPPFVDSQLEMGHLSVSKKA